MARWIRGRDSRPIHYEKDHQHEINDFVSAIYASIDQIIKLGKGEKLNLKGVDLELKDYHDKPVILCEYAHAMGKWSRRVKGILGCFLYI